MRGGGEKIGKIEEILKESGSVNKMKVSWKELNRKERRWTLL